MGTRIFVVAAILTILAAMGIALGIYFRVIPVPMSLLGMLTRTNQPEVSARYYPPDTVAYTWVTVAPRGRQMRHLRETWGRFNEHPGFVSAVEDWKSGFAGDTGISFDEEVAAWIGPTASVGLLDLDPDTSLPTVAAVVGVRDEDAASDFLDKWTDHVSAQGSLEFVTGVYNERPTWVAGPGYPAYGLTSDWVVYATDEETLYATIDRIEGNGEGSLAGSARFRAAQESLPETRFASAYLDYERGEAILAEWSDGFGAITPPLAGSFTGHGGAPEWLAVAATWIDRGLVTEWVTPPVAASGLEMADLNDPATLLPEDTLAFAAASFDPNLDHWRAALEDRKLSDVLPEGDSVEAIPGLVPGTGSDDNPRLGPDSSLAEALDLGLELAHEITGIDLETEFINHLSGTAVLAIRDFDIEAVRSDPTANPVDAVAMLSYNEGDQGDLRESLNRLAELAQTRAAMNVETVDVGGDVPATVFNLGPLGMLTGSETGDRPGFVLHDQYLTVGTTERALAAIVGLQNGQGESLSADAEYRRSMQYLPTARQVLAYVNAHRVVDQLDGEDLYLEEDEYEVVRDALGVFTLGSDSVGDYSRSVAVLTLFPE